MKDEKIFTKVFVKKYEKNDIKLYFKNPCFCCFHHPVKSGIGKYVITINIFDVYTELFYEKGYTKKIKNKYLKKMESTLNFLIEKYYLCDEEKLTEDAKKIREQIKDNILS